MSASDPVVGHKTFSEPDGTFRHEPLLKSEADACWQASERERESRELAMPDESSAIVAMFQAWLRLKEIGWREAVYCPKDGTIFDVVEAGSTGVHECSYIGEWPSGCWFIHGHGDMWPSRPVLFRLKPATTQEEKP